MATKIISNTESVKPNEILIPISLISFAVIPFFVALFSLFIEINGWIEFAEKEQKGAKYHSAVQTLLSHIQQHRGMVSAYLGGDSAFSNILQKKSKEITSQIHVVDELDKKYGALLLTTKQWEEIKNQLSDITKTSLGMQSDESFNYQTIPVQNILNLMGDIVDNSNLITDPELHSNNAINLLTRIPKAAEYSGQARAIGVRIAAKNQSTKNEQNKIIGLSVKITEERDALIRYASIASSDKSPANNRLLKLLENSKISINNLLETIDKYLLNNNSVDIKSKEYFDIASKAVDSQYDLYSTASSTLQSLLQHRINGYNAKIFQATVFSIIVGVVGIIIYGLFFINQKKRRHAEKQLEEHKSHLERNVERRTASLKAATEKLELEKNISESHEIRLRSILNATADGIVTIESNGIIESTNTGTEKLFGYQSNELIGEHINILIPSFGLQGGESLGRNKSGRTSPIYFNVVDTKLKDKLVYTVTIRDVSAIKEAEERLKELSQKIVQLLEDERYRVSRELHDGIIQMLVSLGYKYEMVEEKLAENGIMVTKEFQDTSTLLDSIKEEVRRISHDLRPTILDDMGLFPAVNSLVREVSERSSAHIHLAIPDNCANLRLLPEVETMLYRIAQEALTNVEKHANAQSIEFSIQCSEYIYSLQISDDGKGFDVSKAVQEWGSNKGIGLRNMKERVEFFGGEFVISSNLGKGTMLKVDVPLDMNMSKHD